MLTPRTLPLCLALAALSTTLAAQIQLPPQQAQAVRVDSTYLDNQGATDRVVFASVVKADQAAWLRLSFDKTNLPAGSKLRLTGLADQAVQYLDGASLVEYGNSSAYFNGDAVRLELIAGPRTKANRVLVVSLAKGTEAWKETICGSADDRRRSADKRQGRLSSGCTGWLANSDVMLTAGHCTGSSRLILSFNVPLSASNGALRQSHPDDQYPVNMSTLRRLNGGIGADWAMALVGKNSNTGKLPGDAQGGWYSIGTVPRATTGQNIRITGYGTTSPRNSLNQVQKTHVGPLARLFSTSLGYRTDTTGGNSGSPVIHENTGKVIGIHTHGGCNTSSSSYNRGTRIDRSDLTAALRVLQGKDGKYEPFGLGCRGSNGKRPTLRGVGNPQIGRFGLVRCDNLTTGFGFLTIGLSNRRAKGGYPLPLNFKIIGAPDCFQYSSASVYQRLISIGGTAGLYGYIPRDAGLVGTSFFMQYFASDRRANAFGLTSSNGLKVTIGG